MFFFGCWFSVGSNVTGSYIIALLMDHWFMLAFACCIVYLKYHWFMLAFACSIVNILLLCISNLCLNRVKIVTKYLFFGCWFNARSKWKRSCIIVLLMYHWFMIAFACCIVYIFLLYIINLGLNTIDSCLHLHAVLFISFYYISVICA